MCNSNEKFKLIFTILKEFKYDCNTFFDLTWKWVSNNDVMNHWNSPEYSFDGIPDMCLNVKHRKGKDQKT